MAADLARHDEFRDMVGKYKFRVSVQDRVSFGVGVAIYIINCCVEGNAFIIVTMLCI